MNVLPRAELTVRLRNTMLYEMRCLVWMGNYWSRLYHKNLRTAVLDSFWSVFLGPEVGSPFFAPCALMYLASPLLP